MRIVITDRPGPWRRHLPELAKVCAVGVVLLIAFLACGVAGLLLGLRATSRFKATTRAAQQQQAQERDPWQD